MPGDQNLKEQGSGGQDSSVQRTSICWGLYRVREKELGRGAVGFQWGAGQPERGILTFYHCFLGPEVYESVTLGSHIMYSEPQKRTFPYKNLNMYTMANFIPLP